MVDVMFGNNAGKPTKNNILLEKNDYERNMFKYKTLRILGIIVTFITKQ